MAAEEDKKFDAVLGGFIVRGLRVPAGNLHCPESDVLAAYHERSLLPEEMNSWKEHIVGCARCQAVLAELEATDTIPLRASEDASEREEALAKSPKKSRIMPISRGVRWQWLAPAGALAAGLLVWVAWHENQPSQWKTPAPVKTAKLEPPSQSAPQPPSTLPAQASPPSDQARTDHLARPSNDQAEARGRLSAREAPAPEALQEPEKTDTRVKSVPARPSANKERVARQEAAQDLVAASPAQNQPAQEPQAGLAGAAQTVDVQTETANAQMQAQQRPLGAQKSAAPSPPAAAEAAKKPIAEARALARRPPVAAPPSPSAPAFNDASASQALMARASDWSLIVTPNGKTLWRAGHAGMIEFSRDGGASWSRQTSNVLADLTTGFAPSEKVCWIVGRAGTILLTTDAGSHWALLHSPLEEDLGGVHSIDALHATIWNPGNTKVFETTDGGVSWKPAASP